MLKNNEQKTPPFPSRAEGFSFSYILSILEVLLTINPLK